MNHSQAFHAMLLVTAMSFGQALSSSSASLSPGGNSLSLGQDSVNSTGDAHYKMQVSVDEVRLTFHAVDKSGRPVEDLKVNDLDLFDNEVGPGAIVALQMLKELPLRIGFVVDASGSVSGDLGRNRAIATAAAKTLMQNKDDQGIAIGFRRTRDIYQPWTGNVSAVDAGIRRIGSGPEASLDGTSLFDSLWSTCLVVRLHRSTTAQ